MHAVTVYMSMCVFMCMLQKKLQPPVTEFFEKLMTPTVIQLDTVTGMCDTLEGLCYDRDDRDKLYCMQKLDNTYWLFAYEINRNRDCRLALTLLDSVVVEGVSKNKHCHPRVDSSSHRVYVPCMEFGVMIFHLKGDRLQSARSPLRCVETPGSVAVNTAKSIYVCDYVKGSVYLVNVSKDTVIRELQSPSQIHGPDYMLKPMVSVLLDTAMVCYGYNTLVSDSSDNRTSSRVFETSLMGNVTSVTSDNDSNFFVTDDYNGVHVLSRAGRLRQTMQPCTELGWLRDCAVVHSQLWLAYGGGFVAIVSSD